MRRFTVVAGCWAVLAVAGQAFAQAPSIDAAAATERASRIGEAFTRWAQANAVEQGAVAVRFRGEAVGGAGYGGRGPEDAALVASLSKAVTALCAARMIDRGDLSYDDTVGQALEGLIARVGPPRDPRLSGVTVGQLLSHRAGVVRMLPLAESPADWAPGMRSSLEEQARRVLDEPLIFAPGERYEYSNQAYMLLSYLIETRSGERYEDHCRRVVFDPVGAATARLNPRFPHSPRSGAGGWTVSATDYAKFADQLRPDHPAHGAATRAWLAQREADRPFYGLGYQRRPAGDRWILHHNGLLTEPELSASAQFALWPSGLTVALNVTPARPRALDELMAEIAGIASGRAP